MGEAGDEEREERRGGERQRLVAREAGVGGRPEAQRQLRRRLHGRRRCGGFDRIGVVRRCRVAEGDRAVLRSGLNCYISRGGGGGTEPRGGGAVEVRSCGVGGRREG